MVHALLKIAVGAAASNLGVALARLSGRNSASLNTVELGGVFRQELINDGDVQYSGEIVLGGQTIKAVLDSGSFELVAFSQNCTRCGNRSALYSAADSARAEFGDLVADQTYGSGSTTSVESWDVVKVVNFEVERQMFWQVTSADMPILEDASFQAILGVGPPGSAYKMAADEAEQAKQAAVRGMQRGESKEDWDGIVAHYDEVRDAIRRTPMLLEQADVHIMSTCLRKERLSPGVFVWNDNDPRRLPAGVAKEVRVSGDIYWSAQLRDVRLGGEPIGCQEQACEGVVDTGTSLLAAPFTTVRRITELLKSRGADGCSNLGQLPNLSFKLGDQEFSLPAESYMGELLGEYLEEVKQLMPHVRWPWQHEPEDPVCEAMIMSTEEQDETWILGMPFFRQYYTTFVLGPKFQPISMFFSEATDDCESPGTEQMLRVPKVTRQHRGHLRIDAAKLRAPHWVGRHKKRRGTKWLAKIRRAKARARVARR